MWLGTGIIAILLVVAVVWFARPLSGGEMTVRAIVVSSGSTANANEQSLLDASGFVVAKRQATVSAKIAGKLIEAPLLVGAHVERGEIIAKLDDANTRAALEQAKAQAEHTKANMEAARLAMHDAQPIYQRNVAAFKKGVISTDALEAAKANYDNLESAFRVAEQAYNVARANIEVAQQTQNDTVVRAPFSGVVTVKAAQAGEIISPISAGAGFTRTGIATIVDMTSLEVVADIGENFLGRVHVNQPVSIRIAAYPDLVLSGRVTVIVPEVNRATANIQVYVRFDKIDPRLLPDMTARVSFFAGSADPIAKDDVGVLVPTDAVQASGDNGTVFRIRHGRIELTPVKLGTGTADKQRILTGVNPGDRLVVGDLQRLKDGLAVTIKE